MENELEYRLLKSLIGHTVKAADMVLPIVGECDKAPYIQLILDDGRMIIIDHVGDPGSYLTLRGDAP